MNEISATDGRMTASPTRAHKRPRVLIIDDDQEIRSRACRTLLREEMEIQDAATVADGIDCIDQWQPDAIIVDLLFEHGSGLDLIRAYRKSVRGRRGVVLVVSVLDDFQTKLEAMRVGSDGFFTKPVDWDALARRLLPLVLRSDEAQPQRILLVEDDIIDATRTRTLLGASGYQVLICDDSTTFAADLDGFQPDLILMDVFLPGASGFELARFVRQHDRHAATPIIFLTIDSTERAQVQAITSGGDDHLAKPVVESLLLRSIEARIKRSKTIKTLLERDGLTGLLTHSVFMSRLSEIVSDKQRNRDRAISLALIDLDHFKEVNDRYGHVVGDKVLTALAAFLRAQLRTTDILGRYGGEEFAVAFPDTDAVQARNLVDRLLHAFAAVSHRSEEGAAFQVTFSAGISELDAGWSIEEWKVLADSALYEAKEKGRNRVIIGGHKPRRIGHTTGILDTAVVASLRELGRRSNTDLLMEVVDLFLRISPDRVRELREAMSRRDARAIELTAHAFRSSSANLGASALSSYCERIESLARSSDLDPIEPLMTELEFEYRRVCDAIDGISQG